jgi:hypothetical protein
MRHPKEGDKRKTLKFAWKRTYVEDRLIWLEFYEVTLLFRKIGSRLRWVEAGRRLWDGHDSM